MSDKPAGNILDQSANEAAKPKPKSASELAAQMPELCAQLDALADRVSAVEGKLNNPIAVTSKGVRHTDPNGVGIGEKVKR